MDTVSLKLLVDKSTQKVIYAEAGKDFVDFLFGLLELPLGSLLKDGMCQSRALSKVYQSVDKLRNEYLQPGQDKQTLLNPAMPASNTKGSPLMQQFGYRKSHASTSSGLFGASTPASFGASTPFGPSPGSFGGSSPASFGIHPGSLDPFYEVFGGAIPGSSGPPRSGDRKEEVDGYVKGSEMYMISDDLTVEPMPSISSLIFINSLGVKDIGTLEEKIVNNIDKKKALQLVRASFVSNTVLTDVFIGRR